MSPSLPTELPPGQAPLSTNQPPEEDIQYPEDAATWRRTRLESVKTWFYHLGFEPEDRLLARLATSTYDMVVIEPIFTDKENTDFPIQEWVPRLHNAKHPKLVLAYVDIGQAEDWRIYWDESWGIGKPVWIATADPDGWEGNFPVLFWYDEWQDIWLKETGILQRIIQAGFDGIYLDWVEVYSDETVGVAAEKEGVDPVQEIIWWISDLASFGRMRNPNFIVIAQNSAELVHDSEYIAIIDAIAQEQVWFDGGADNEPPGDCPLPRNDKQVESSAYVSSLSPTCKALYANFPQSTLHTSSASYLQDLILARQSGLPVFTIDYATETEHVTWVYHTARQLGFIPFVSIRSLDIYLEPVD